MREREREREREKRERENENPCADEHIAIIENDRANKEESNFPLNSFFRKIHFM